MRDPRVALFSGLPITISTATTTNGSTLDLKNLGLKVDGDLFAGSPVGYGLGVEMLFYDITGTDVNVSVKWQVSDDGSTWVDDQQVIPTSDLDTLDNGGTKIVVSTRLVTKRRYARLVVITTGMVSSSVKLNAWLSDGTNPYAFALNTPFVRK